MNYSVFLKPPADFKPTVQVAGCFCEWGDKILFLKRLPKKPHGSTWGLPAGKLEAGETPRQGAIREVAEEVGLNIENDLHEVGKIYIQLEHVSYTFHMFAKRFRETPEIILELEAHEEAKWVTVKEALELPLIIGGKEVIECYIKWQQQHRERSDS